MPPDDSPPHILCINPWIHDYAAYDHWAAPLGLMWICAILRDHGMRVSYIDCLNRFHPMAEESGKGNLADGRGAYRKTPIPPPKGLADMPGRYFRYGIDPSWFAADLAAAVKPDLILMTSLMTYWYGGVKEAITEIRRVYPDVPVILGGIYATLLPRHAREHTGADEVIEGAGEMVIFKAVEKYTGFAAEPTVHPPVFDPTDMNTFPYPAFDMQSAIPYIPLLTTRGCPNRCAYCAARILQPRRMSRDPDHVAAEIRFWHETHGVRNFAFYDDALLLDAESHAVPLFEKIAGMKRDLWFHTPNAIHVRPITARVARSMFAAGFRNIRMGLETTDADRQGFDNKVCREEFVEAVRVLLEAGFEPDRLGAYLLVGLPGQDFGSVGESIDTVARLGVRPALTYYTPIPGTRMWAAACRLSRYDLEADPVFTNNAVMPCMPEYDQGLINSLRQRAQGFRG